MDRQAYKILILFLICAAGCVKDKPAPPATAHDAKGDVYIVCEGNFGNGDGTLYSYDPLTDSTWGDIYKAVNGQMLGDVFQSMIRMGDSLYLCVNNSDKVVVLNAADHKLAGTISIPKPRYILPTGEGGAYVSTLYSNKVYTIDSRTLQVTGSVTLPYQNTEGMCLQQGSVFVSAWDTLCNYIYKIDAASGSIMQEIKTGGYAPHAVLADREQMLWVLSGNVTRKRNAALTRIDPSTGSILKTYLFPASADPLKPVFNPTRDTLYFIQVKYDGSAADNGIYRMGIHEAELPAAPFIQSAQYQYFWALGIEPGTGNIYVGDPRGFIQKGRVIVYREDGSEINSFSTGLGPGQFYFDK
jgi:DNA-binding beta-propeller fold protein YncE